jgi:hypothetical protein
MTSEYDEIKQILIKHDALGMDLDQIVEYGEPLYEALFDYYMHSGEMPYGTMKARDGDPDVWIADRLYELGLIKEEQNDPNGLPLNFTNKYHQEEEA